jgi:hypothetical protein
MRFHNIVTQTQSQAGSLSGGFGGEEGLEDFIDDVGGDAGAVVCITEILTPLPPEGGFWKAVLIVTVGTYFI